MFNQIGERVLRKYVQFLSDSECINNLKFDQLCEEAVQNGSKRINYTSLRMTDTMKDIWRFRENLIHILHELQLENVSFSVIKENFFDFNDFYEMANRLDRAENLYVLVTDAFHDMDINKTKLLTEFRWDMILDYDGYSKNGGLRDYASGQNIKDLVGDCKVVRESVLRREIASWIRIGEQIKFSLCKSVWSRKLSEKVVKIYHSNNGLGAG